MIIYEGLVSRVELLHPLTCSVQDDIVNGELLTLLIPIISVMYVFQIYEEISLSAMCL